MLLYSFMVVGMALYAICLMRWRDIHQGLLALDSHYERICKARSFGATFYLGLPLLLGALLLTKGKMTTPLAGVFMLIPLCFICVGSRQDPQEAH